MVAGRPMLGKASELVVAGRPMLTLEVKNEACERLISRLWWYKCYRGTLLREGTPPVLGVENEDHERLVKSVVKSPKRHKSPRRHHCPSGTNRPGGTKSPKRHQIAQEAANHIE